MSDQLWAKNLPLDATVHAFTVGDDPLTDEGLLPFDIEGSAAHARMLGECGLVPLDQAKFLVRRLRELKDSRLTISKAEEDCHTALEHALGEAGSRIHLARSRNDQVQTALRLLMRARLLDLGELFVNCASEFVILAKKRWHAILPGYTHLRRAMPSAWGMWSASFAEALAEELEQLPALWLRINRSPLGAGAGFGAPAAISRERTAELLGFDRVQRSPIDVMNSRGRYEYAISAWIVSAAGTLEKAVWDLLIWSTDEFGFVRLPDAFTTGSSLMPQKRNPDVLELARGRCRELRGLAALISQLAGGLPSSYHRDHQLLKAPFLQLVSKAWQLFAVMARVLPVLEIDERASAAACTDEIFAAREACRVAEAGVPFREAYMRVAQQLQTKTFVAEPTSPSQIDLAPLERELEAHGAWIRQHREFLANISTDLFAWT
ncbi:MAG: argininosuccinate lyase [Verrucomicrobia bacterium]|nr:argininosuccinate lyase [Verrucomicrobiota bacterium]